jgi:hypothetical protein
MHHFREIALAGLAVWFIFGTGIHPSPLSVTAIISAQAPVISITPQPDAPIRISLGKILSDNPYEPAFEYSLLNVSDKSIRAHVIRTDDWLMGSTLSIHKFPWESRKTQPGSYGENMKSSEPIERVRISIDFVEFVDGTTWGPNTTNAAERLAAHHVGWRAERDRLLNLLEEGGTTAVITDIEPDDIQITPPSGHSAHWEGGYRLGVRHYRHDLRHAYSQQGVAAMETLLRHPTIDYKP